MKPRKFIYSETSFCSDGYKIEWVEDHLELISPYYSFYYESDLPRINLFPSDQVWKIFKSSIENLNIVVDSTIDDLCDGIQIFCWITFNKRLVKFDQTNPSFNGFHALKKYK